MQRPVGIRIVVTFLAMLPVIVIATALGLSRELVHWTLLLALAPFSTFWYWWLIALWHHRNFARWLVNICTLMTLPLWLLSLSVATTASEIWHNRIYLSICLALLIYMNLPKVRHWFLQPPPEHEPEITFDQADYR